MATFFEYKARGLVRFINPFYATVDADWYVHGKRELHRKINAILERQRKDYNAYRYFSGYSYQALGILGIYGERPTEERFDLYEIAKVVSKEDRVLDIGCNAGFMAVITAYRTGAYAEGIDINPYTIEVGQVVAEYLRLSDIVHLHATPIQEFECKEPYSVVFSFATHWTDDAQYRVSFRDHFERMASYLKADGVLVFETHAADLQKENYEEEITSVSDIFSMELKKETDGGERHLYHFRKK